jgi:uncharacterized protein (TIGR00369 family)
MDGGGGGGGGGDETPGPRKITEGEFAGWWTWSGVDPYEALAGPFYAREIDGQPRCAFRAEARHMNSFGAMHGGCMMTFADFALFSLSQRARGGVSGVTVNLNGGFLGPAYVGEWIEAAGEVTRTGKSLTFVRGMLTANGRPMLSFSGVIKAVKRRGLQASEVG